MAHRQVRTALAVLAFCVVASPASAQWSEDSMASPSRGGFGAKGLFAISVERVFGFTSSTLTIDGGMVENSTTTQSISFLTRADNPSPYNVPRLAFDYFVVDSVSLGASFGYATSTPETETTGGGTTTTTEGDTRTGLVFNFRGGYAHMFTRAAGIWPRLGFTYYSLATDDAQSSAGATVSGFAMGLEALFVLAPVEHFAFTVGPALDLGLTGSTEIDTGGSTMDTDTTITDIAITVGVLGWL